MRGERERELNTITKHYRRAVTNEEEEGERGFGQERGSYVLGRESDQVRGKGRGRGASAEGGRKSAAPFGEGEHSSLSSTPTCQPPALPYHPQLTLQGQDGS